MIRIPVKEWKLLRYASFEVCRSASAAAVPPCFFAFPQHGSRAVVRQAAACEASVPVVL